MPRRDCASPWARTGGDCRCRSPRPHAVPAVPLLPIDAAAPFRGAGRCSPGIVVLISADRPATATLTCDSCLNGFLRFWRGLDDAPRCCFIRHVYVAPPALQPPTVQSHLLSRAQQVLAAQRHVQHFCSLGFAGTHAPAQGSERRFVAVAAVPAPGEIACHRACCFISSGSVVAASQRGRKPRNKRVPRQAGRKNFNQTTVPSVPAGGFHRAA